MCVSASSLFRRKNPAGHLYPRAFSVAGQNRKFPLTFSVLRFRSDGSQLIILALGFTDGFGAVMQAARAGTRNALSIGEPLAPDPSRFGLGPTAPDNVVTEDEFSIVVRHFFRYR